MEKANVFVEVDIDHRRITLQVAAHQLVARAEGDLITAEIVAVRPVGNQVSE